MALAVGFGISGHNLRVADQEIGALLADIQAQGGRTPLDDVLLETYDRRQDFAHRLMAGMGAVAIVFTGVGAGLLSWSLKGRSSTRARLNPYGGPHGAGLSIVGRF